MSEKTDTTNNILEILCSDRERFFSGEEISRRLSISRAAVWKHIKALRESGANIQAVTNCGYKLASLPDVLNERFIRQYLNTEYMGKTIATFDEADSTNRIAKELAAQGASAGTCVISEHQTSGRGRRGRWWFSEKGKGICISVVLRPDLPPALCPRLVLASALALKNTLNCYGIEGAKIKWPNDVLVSGKKISGILLEMSANIESVEYVVVGIGVNINNQCFPDEIADIATSMRLAAGKDFDRNEFAAVLLKQMEEQIECCYDKDSFIALMQRYKDASSVLGRSVTIHRVNDDIEGLVVDFDDMGRICLKTIDDKIQIIDAGDVSLRLS